MSPVYPAIDNLATLRQYSGMFIFGLLTGIVLTVAFFYRAPILAYLRNLVKPRV